ncbi:MAG: tetratricopeptide repeat protein [Acidobacteria bacterium]|nr:tetratricopeptide repeat protein [Acidobacteriota bacterium]
MRRLTAIFALFLLALSAGAQQDAPELARGLLAKGDQARQAKRYEEAISNYERVLAVAPTMTRAYLGLGTIYLEQGKADEAYDVLTRAVQRANPDQALFATAAAAAQQLGKASEALGLIDRAIAIEKRDPSLLARRAAILRSLGRNDEALVAIIGAVQVAPKDARYRLNAGNLLLAMGRDDDAIASFRAATNLDRSLLRAWLNLGAIYTRKRLWQPAIEAYENVVRLTPNDVSAQYNLGQLYYSTNQRERAEEEYRKALTKEDALPLAHLHLGELALNRGEYDRAIQLLASGMQYYDTDTKTLARRLLGRAQLAQGNRAAARMTFEEALQANDAEASLPLARIARLDGRLEDAKALLDRAPQSPAAHLERVHLTRATGDLAAERKALEEVLANRNDAALRTELALVQLRLGDVEAARANAASLPALTRAVLLRDAATLATMTSPIARGDAGLLLWSDGKAAQAKPHLAAARAAISDWPEVALALGELAISDRQFDTAIELLSTQKCGDVCDRMQRSLGIALLHAAADDPRRARAFLDRAATLPLDERGQAALAALRESLAPRPAPDAPAVRDENTNEPRRTAIVYLPDLPTESDKRLAEAVRGMLGAMPVRLQVELFRRADDARAFYVANRERVGVVLANRELVETFDLDPRFQLTRGGSRYYRRIVVVPLRSAIRSLDDLRGHTVSAVDLLRDAGAGNVVRVPDDLTAAANVLFGRTDAAVVAEANPLVAQHAGELRAITTLPAAPLPVVAFAPMLPGDRAALDGALPRARLLGYGVSRIETETPVAPPRPAPRIDLPRVPEPLRNVPLRFEQPEKMELPEM